MLPLAIDNIYYVAHSTFWAIPECKFAAPTDKPNEIAINNTVFVYSNKICKGDFKQKNEYKYMKYYWSMYSDYEV